jgi:hypothetical protein
MYKIYTFRTFLEDYPITSGNYALPGTYMGTNFEPKSPISLRDPLRLEKDSLGDKVRSLYSESIGKVKDSYSRLKECVSPSYKPGLLYK